MGKRKSSSKPAPKRRADPLATTFKCVFCHREKAVSVKMDKQEMYGHLTCKECGQRYSSPINTVDVYCDWKDACEEIRLKQPAQSKPVRPRDPIAHGAAGGAAFNAGGRAFEKDADRAGVEESDEEDGGAGRKESRAVGYLEPEDDEEEDAAEEEAADIARREKKRRVVVESEDEEDED